MPAGRHPASRVRAGIRADQLVSRIATAVRPAVRSPNGRIVSATEQARQVEAAVLAEECRTATWQGLFVIVFGSWRHLGLILQDMPWLARWRSLAPTLFAQRGQCRDLPDELRPQCPGQVVAHAGEPREPGVRDRPGDRQAAARRDQRVMQPVDDQCRDRDAAQRRGAVRLARARCELPPGAVGVIAAVIAPAG